MMKKLIFIAISALLLAIPAFAQAELVPKSCEIGPYTIDIISKDVYHIQDFNTKNPAGESFNAQGEKTHFNNCSDMYLLVGKEIALLIDLSNYITWDDTAIESLRKLVKDRIHGLPLTITFTHNHGDHTGMVPAYANDKSVHFALPRIDFEPLKDKLPEVDYSFYDGGKTFDLGGMKINTLLVPGHTHGSMVFFLEGRDMVFTGDAIGSGHGVWIFNAEGFKEYVNAVPALISYIENPANNIDTQKLHFWGGHYWQKDWIVETQNPDIDWKYLKDMQALISQISKGTAKHEPSNLNHRHLDTYFRYNNAIVVWNLNEAMEYSKKQ